MNMPPPPASEMNDKYKIPKPERIRDYPAYVLKVLKDTFYRMHFVMKLVWETQPLLFLFRMLMTVYHGVMPLVGTLITANLLEKVVLRFTEDVDIVPALLWQFGYLFLNTLTSSLSNLVSRISGEQVTNHIKIKIMKKAKCVDMASFDMPDFYERLENANREASVRPINILNNTFGLISTIISAISYFTVLGVILSELPSESILFFTLFLVLSVTSAAVSFHYRRKNHRYMFRRSKDRRQMNYYGDMMTNKDIVKELRLFDLSDLFIGKYQAIFNDYFKGMKSLIRRENAWNITFSLLTAAVNGVLFYMIAMNVTQIGDYTVYTGALNAISSAVASVITTVASIYEGSLFIDNLILFMGEKQTVVPISNPPVIPETGIGHTIEFRNVSFRYPGAEVNVLDGINVTFEAGKTVALVGINGAGKTTMIKLITRLYDPTEGVIYLDGKDIREYDLQSLYGLYGIIFQDFAKYAETVADNIAFGRVSKEKTDEAVKLAAERAGVDGYVEKLPLKYETPLTRWFNADGKELSIGQWQKLSVARAFYSDADILILDEPTASLDALAEQEIYNRFDELRKGKTGIFVSHRLSSATTADRVIVLSGGKITESGTHSELMALHGEYYKLFSTQAKHYQFENGGIPEPPPDMPHMPHGRKGFMPPH